MNLKHNSPSLQGMQIAAARLFLGEHYRVEIDTTEEGFSEILTWDITADFRGIHWKPAHYWLRQVIDYDLEQRIIYLIGIHSDAQPF